MQKDRWTTILLIGLIFVLCLCFFVGAKRSIGWSNNFEVKTYVVQHGDTIDGLYYKFANIGSVERYRYEIKTINGMEDCKLLEGDAIWVFTKKS